MAFRLHLFFVFSLMMLNTAYAASSCGVLHGMEPDGVQCISGDQCASRICGGFIPGTPPQLGHCVGKALPQNPGDTLCGNTFSTPLTVQSHATCPKSGSNMFYTPCAEIPTWQIEQGWHTYYVTTDKTYRCSSPKTLLGTFSLDLQYCGLVSKFYTNTVNPAWNTMYDGLFSAHTLQPWMMYQTSGDPITIAFDHVENKNTSVNGTLYQNTFQPWIPVSGPNKCISGYNAAGVYDDCWTAYNGLVEMSWQVSNASTNWGGASYYQHEGPVVWPTDGYIRPWTTSDPAPKYSQGVSTHGVRHPHSIIYGEFIYLYYADASPSNSGIKLARSFLAEKGMPGTFRSYGSKGFSSQPDALPAGFNLAHIEQFVSKSGPANMPILGMNRQSVSFSAAQVGSSKCFAGVEEVLDPNGGWSVVLWKSPDLMHWSSVSVLATASEWGKGKFHYPIFLDSSGTNNTKISTNMFYIEGTDNSGSGGINLMPVQANNFCSFLTTASSSVSLSR